MQFLSKENSKQWYDSYKNYEYRIFFETFNSTFNRCALDLSYILFDQLSKDSRKLIWFTDWPFCKDIEMKMFERFRQSYGEKKDLIKTPGHVFDAEENLDALVCLTYSFLFLWDIHLVTDDGQHRIFVSHDGCAAFESNNQEHVADVQQQLKNLELKIIS